MIHVYIKGTVTKILQTPPASGPRTKDFTNTTSHHGKKTTYSPKTSDYSSISPPLQKKMIYTCWTSNTWPPHKWYVEKNVVKAVKSAQLGKRLFSFFVLSTRYWSSTATSTLRLSEEFACHMIQIVYQQDICNPNNRQTKIDNRSW